MNIPNLVPFVARSLLLCTVLLLPQASAAPPIKTVRIAAGQTGDLWLGVNVRGKVFYSIKTRDGKNALRMWWIKLPLGTVKQIGIKHDAGSLDIPTLMNGSVSAKLRGSASSDTVIYVRDNAAVDNNVTFKWPER